MKRLAYILLFVSVGLVCEAQKFPDSSWRMLSEEFNEEDSLTIVIEYRDLKSCLDDQLPEMFYIFIYDGKSYVSDSKTKESEGIKAVHENVLDVVQLFERKARDTFKCGGYGGGNGVIVRLKINGIEDEFGYCKDDWDGIDELRTELDRRKN